MSAVPTRRRTGPPPKGDRKEIMVRLPRHHVQYFANQAASMGLSAGDYVGYRAAICEGLPIPAEVFWHAPRLILLYEDPEQRREIIATMPENVIKKFWQHVPEVAELLPAMPGELQPAG